MHSSCTHLPLFRRSLNWFLFSNGLLVFLASFGANTSLLLVQFGCYFIGVNYFQFFDVGFLRLDKPAQILQLSLGCYLILPLHNPLFDYSLHIRQILSILQIPINLLFTPYLLLHRNLRHLLLILGLTVEDAMDIDGYPTMLLHIY